MKTKLILLSLLALPMVGCVSNQAAKIAEALKDNPAAISISIVTPWGTAQATRVGNNTNSIALTPSGADVNVK